jgi:hypothetical protein
LTASLAYAVLSAPDAGAATVQSYNYSTNGSIAGQTGVAPITFIGVNSQTLTTPGTFSLGQFDAVNMLPTSGTLTYNNTPFAINLNVASGSGTYYTYLAMGTLTGSINGAGGSDMVATISSITGVPPTGSSTPTTPPFPASDLQFSTTQGINAPNAMMGTDGLTNLYAQVIPDTTTGLGLPAAAPEPASIAVLGLGLVAWGVRRRVTRSKRPVGN